MGYISKNIADITEPKTVTLAKLPNFVKFASKTHTRKKLEVNITVKLTSDTPSIDEISIIKIIDYAKGDHTFTGTKEKENVGGNTFFVSKIPSETAENLRQVLLSDRWIASNFDIVIPFVWEGETITNGSVINIKSKGAGSEFNIELSAPNDTEKLAYIFEKKNSTSTSGDTISGENSTAEIEVDLYTNTGVFLGEDDRGITASRLGTPITSLQKTYAGTPIWFELNTIFSNSIGYNRPTSSGWFDTGTIKDVRLVAKVKSENSYPFYQSNVLYILNGHAPLNNQPDLDEYIYNNSSVKLLTNKPRTSYIRGQKAYLNFIFSDPRRNEDSENYELQVAYRVYTQSGRYLGTEYAHNIRRLNLSIVNTCVLNIDSILDKYPNAGLVKVALAKYNNIISNDLEYSIRPDYLHTLRQFSFINALGGWDCFNFDAPIKTDIKQSTETFNKTLTPDYSKSDSIETIYTSNVEKTYTIESAPISDEVAQWLEELAAAITVLDDEGRYVVKDDFTMQLTVDKKNMQKATLKYRLNE